MGDLWEGIAVKEMWSNLLCGKAGAAGRAKIALW